MKIKSLKIAAAIAAAILTLSSCGNKKVMNVSTAFAEYGVVEQSVMATGYIQPVEMVEVGTQVSGVIEEIYADFNSVVKKGDLLAVLDKVSLEERLTQANASLASARSNLTYAQQNYDRVNQLYNAKASTTVALEEAVNRLEVAQTSYEDAQANVRTAEVNLSYAYIYSPIDGVVLDRNVAEGQTVAASFSTPTLFTIAEDLTKMQVEADVDEADIGQVEVGQRVTFTVDAYPDDIFEGTVSQVRLQPTVTNNVVTYTVIVEAPNPDEKLFPGMTANITTVTRSESGIIVPSSALAFRMTPEIASRLEVGDQAVAESSGAGQGVWVSSSSGFSYRPVIAGINDGVEAVVESGLTEGDEVILNVNFVSKFGAEAASNPLMPQRRR